MKKILSLLIVLVAIASTACKKEKNETKREIDLVGKWELTFGKTEYFDSTKTKIHTELFEASSLGATYEFKGDGTLTVIFSAGEPIYGTYLLQQGVNDFLTIQAALSGGTSEITATTSTTITLVNRNERRMKSPSGQISTYNLVSAVLTKR